MDYHITASSVSNEDAVIFIKQSIIDFGTTKETEGVLPNPLELFLGSFASCILKNVERFSGIMKFSYSKASIDINATRHENPPRVGEVTYKLTIYSDDQKLNTDLLKKNIEKFGTIYNTLKQSCTISGTITISDDV